ATEPGGRRRGDLGRALTHHNNSPKFFYEHGREMSFHRPAKPSARALALLCAVTALFCLSALRAARAQTSATPPQTEQIQPAQTPTPTPTPSPSPTPSPTPAPLTGEEDEEVERITTELTNVLLTAMDKKRRFVTTIGEGDIRVLEDGVPQQVLFFQRETDLPLSIAFLVDTSASQEGVLRDEQEAARTFIESVLRPRKDSAAVISFTGVTRVEQPLTGDRAALDAAVGRVKVLYNIKSPECSDSVEVAEEVRIRCLTAVWDTILITLREVLSHTPESTRRAIILLSDGDDTGSKSRIFYAVEEAIKQNTVIYAIGIRDEEIDVGELKKDYLRRVSEETGGRAFFPKNKTELSAAFAQIEQELRSQYLISYSPSNKTPDGRFRRVEVEITNPALRKQKLRLLYRQGYYARGGPAPAQTTVARP
ncbi:MAG TPA: VWA domain-containing protein, partial [Pyrinomonadaceae bacterium]|nr:VWA domain-containing protein [Pyrinomonadaceae bacterium]